MRCFIVDLTNTNFKNNCYARFNLVNSSHSDYWMAIWLFLFFIGRFHPYPFGIGHNRDTVAFGYRPKTLVPIINYHP